MKPILCKELSVLNGTWYGDVQDQVITRVVIDSRQITEGTLFVAMKGERVDSHRFIDDAYAKGAVAVFCSNEYAAQRFADGTVDLPDGKLLFASEDPVISLGRLAAWYRSGLSIPIVAVTGSVGKTSAKDMIAAALNGGKKTYKTPGNLNNKFGLPLSVLSIEEDHEAAVIEMGMNHFGEIRYLADIVRPDIGVITNIGVSHIEFLGSQEGILKAKTEMLEFMDEHCRMFLCGDDPLLCGYSKTMTIPFSLYGFGENCDVRAASWQQDGDTLRVEVGDGTCLQTQTLGRHMVWSVLAAYGIARTLGLSAEEAARGIASFTPTQLRMNISEEGAFKVLDDSYNASPASVKAAIDVLCMQEPKAGGRRAALLGDMFELGFYAPAAHREIGEYAASHGIDLIAAAGAQASQVLEGAESASCGEKKPALFAFASTKELSDQVLSLLRPNDVVLVKASRGMAFDTIAKQLREVR